MDPSAKAVWASYNIDITMAYKPELTGIMISKKLQELYSNIQYYDEMGRWFWTTLEDSYRKAALIINIYQCY